MANVTRTNAGMIEVVRCDYEAHDESRFGTLVHVPAYYRVQYRYSGRTIARYNSKEDVLVLNCDCLYYDRRWIWNKDERLPLYERALAGKYKGAYEYLFAMLGVDADTQLSEYIDL